jgi:hypothetical protein
MVIALTAEADAPAMKVLMAELIAERTAVYLAFVRAGLVSSSDALAPVVGDVAAPGTVVQSNPSASSDVVQAAATASIRIRAKNEEAGVLASYDAIIAAFKALAAEHAKLESSSASVDVSEILAQSQRIEAIAAAVFKKK